MSGREPRTEEGGDAVSGQGQFVDTGESAGDERLVALLRDLVRDAGRMKTAESLGVSSRTLARAVDTGALLPRMRDALKRRVLEEGGEEGVRQRARVEALERRVEGLEERLAALEQGGEGAGEVDAGAVGELARRLEGGAEAVETLAGRVSRLEESRAAAHRDGPAGSGDGERALRGGRGVVTREPHPGEAESYGAGMPLVEEWRALCRRRGEGSTVDQARRRERIMELEITIIGEHGLALPPNAEPLHPSERERYLGWRRRELADLRGERRRRVALRWVRRAFTLATTLTVTGTLDGAALTTDTVVSLTLEAGTATASADYTVGSAAATLRIAARATSGTASFALTPVDDMIDDDDETVTIASSSTSTLTLTPASLTVTITDNDEPNVAPVFEPLALTHSLEENSGADVAVGAAVTATDANGDTLSYSLVGTGAGSFRIDSASGQISTAPGVAYDYESATNRFALTVTANDPRGGDASATVIIDISDVDEPPPRPAAPSVSPTRGETDSLDVSWIAPSTSGRPDLSGYELHYRTGRDAWASWSHTGTGIVATIDKLSPDTNYDVQVRAINDEGESRWSPSGDGSTFSTDDPCLALGPTPTVVAVTSVPIVVASTTDVYFVLYVTHELDGAEVLTPVAVVVGKAGTTTLGENVEALPAGRYRVEQYNVANPADIDGDCIDDLTELAVMGRMNPLNPAPAILRNDGAVAIPDSDTFEELSYTEPSDDYEYVKFALLDMDTDHPLLYFINSTTHLRHPIVLFLDAIDLRAVQDSVPNAYIKDAIDNEEINALIARYVRYEVTADGYKLRAATNAEVDAHHAASRPARTQTPERDLLVTKITPLSEVHFEDWRAFGVKAANVAVLGTLGLSRGHRAQRVCHPLPLLQRVHEQRRPGGGEGLR